MQATSIRLPAWCERRQTTERDGRYVVACYFTRDGHPVSRAHAEKIQLTEYATDGTPLRVEEGIVRPGPSEQTTTVLPAGFRFVR